MQCQGGIAKVLKTFMIEWHRYVYKRSEVGSDGIGEKDHLEIFGSY